MTALQILASSNIFRELPEEGRSRIAGESKLKSATKGEVLWQPMTSSGAFGVVGTGFIKMTKTTCGGSELTLELFGPGETFGLNGLLEGKCCPLRAEAIAPTKWLRVPVHLIAQMRADYPDWSEFLLRHTLGRLRRTLNGMPLAMMGSAEQRLAGVLLRLDAEYAEPEADRRTLTVELTRSVLAELAGTTTETAIRVMRKWEDGKLVERDRRTITILDSARLAQLARMI